MAAKVINFHSPDGKNTYELTFTRDSVEAAERAGFQIGQYTQMTNLLSNSRALFYGAFIARNKGIRRKVTDEMFQHIEENHEVSGAFTVGNIIAYTGGNSSDAYTYKFSLDASKSNAIYGRSATVQPAAYYVHIWRRVA